MFFTALNPHSKQSGIVYSLTEDKDFQGKEMVDKIFIEQFIALWTQPIEWVKVRSNPGGVLISFDFFSKLHEIIIGNHYDLSLRGHGSKGLLDYLIFPLIARKLIADCYLPDREKTYLCNTAAFIIALPLEFVRLGIGYGLSIALIFTFSLGYLFKSFVESALGCCIPSCSEPAIR